MSALTPREMSVLECLSEGMTNPQIGEFLFLSKFTVKSHLERMALKLGTGDRAGMVGVAFRTGLLL